jgi:phospholipase B-like protein
MRSVRSRLPFVVFSLLLAVLGCALLTAQFAGIGRRQAALAAAHSLAPAQSADDTTFDKGYRFEKGGWIYVHLEGSPHDVGFQHGYLLGPEIADAFAAVSVTSTHQTNRNWDFFRRAAREMLWPKIDAEYQMELQGIADGLAARKIKLDLDDIIAMNAFEELPWYYVPWLNERTHAANAPKISSPGNCSAFVATGSWTKDHQIVMAHNNWTNYANGERWRIIFDIVPQQGYRILMDGFPGVIISDDDFGVNSAGLMVTETTISAFHGWDPNGKAEFARARKAMQYAGSIDEFVKIMLDGNNGGYANDWLVGDRKTGEIAQFELGLKKTKLYRTKDGYFVGSNFPSDPEVMKLDTTFDPKNMASSPNARRARWEELMMGSKGKIDVEMAQAFESDHSDTYAKKTDASRRTLCGHGDVDGADDPNFGTTAYEPEGAVQGKVIDSAMAKNMTLLARVGHPCGTDFNAAKFLEQHPEYSWLAPVLNDMKVGPWTEFRTGEQAPASPNAPKGLSAGH